MSRLGLAADWFLAEVCDRVGAVARTGDFWNQAPDGFSTLGTPCMPRRVTRVQNFYAVPPAQDPFGELGRVSRVS